MKVEGQSLDSDYYPTETQIETCNKTHGSM